MSKQINWRYLTDPNYQPAPPPHTCCVCFDNGLPCCYPGHPADDE